MDEIVRFLKERHTERFFNPIEFLRRAPGNYRGFGFAIMSLCCLLIETLQCYRAGLPSSDARDLQRMKDVPENTGAPGEYKLTEPFDAGSEKMFEDFFKLRQHQKFFPGMNEMDGEEFYRQIRCGLLHQAQTKDAWRIVRTGAFWAPAPKKAINRDEFSERLRDCFMGYLQELAGEQNWNADIWKSCRKKIWWLIQVS